MHSFTVVDAHCDTISEIYRPLNLYQNEGHLDLVRLKEYQSWLQFFAIWIEPELDAKKAFLRCEQIIGRFYEQIKKNSTYIEQVTNIGEIESAFRRRKIAAFLALEGGSAIGSDLSLIDWFYEKGIRCIALTWNNSNLLGTGAAEKRPKYGLTELGRQAVQRMNELGIIVDVSHMSEKSFWDVQKYCRAPFVATHSNSKACCDHARNLTDEQFLAIKESGGVVGINFCPLFVSGRDKAGIDDLVKHIEHFLSLGGEDHVGLGSDFDGIENTPIEIRGVQDMYLLFDRLAQLNYPDSLITKIASKNFLRVIKQVC